jgi:WD40 repeat protein
MLASAGADNSVRLWDVASHKPIGEPLPGHKVVVANWVINLIFSADNKMLAAGSKDGAVTLWDVDETSWEKIACFIANRNLTRKEWDEYVGDAMTHIVLCPGLPEASAKIISPDGGRLAE